MKLRLLITIDNNVSMNYCQKLILDKLNQTEVVSIAILAQELAVLRMTIHRDLEAFQRAGLILKQLGEVFAQPNQLIGAESAVAQTVELHKLEVNDQGVMVMLE